MYRIYDPYPRLKRLEIVKSKVRKHIIFLLHFLHTNQRADYLKTNIYCKNCYSSRSNLLEEVPWNYRFLYKDSEGWAFRDLSDLERIKKWQFLLTVLEFEEERIRKL